VESSPANHRLALFVVNLYRSWHLATLYC